MHTKVARYPLLVAKPARTAAEPGPGARHFARPQTLVLDEAMSAVDRYLEDRMRSALDTRLKGGPLLLIPHRIETVLSADNIACLANGRVVWSGPSQSLFNGPENPLARVRPAGRGGANRISRPGPIV